MNETTITQKIWKAGNTLVITIDKNTLEILEAKTGDILTGTLKIAKRTNTRYIPPEHEQTTNTYTQAPTPIKKPPRPDTPIKGPTFEIPPLE